MAGTRRQSPGQLWAKITRRPAGRAGRRRDLILLGSVIMGCIIAMLTGWLILIVILPALALGLPYLLILPKQRDIELLEALDRWVRSLAATLATGKSITDAIRISRRTAPPLIADEISLLVARLNNRWETRDALMRFADAIDSPDADGVVAALILASSRGANGASVTLQALADSIQAQLKGRRAVEVERSKPYVVVRQVTIISLSTLVLRLRRIAGLLRAVPHTSRSGAAVGAVDQLRWLAAVDATQGAPAHATPHPHRRASMIISLVLLSGMLLAGGLSCLVVAFARLTPRLDGRRGADRRRRRGPPDRQAMSVQSAANPNGWAPCCTALHRSRCPTGSVGRYGCRTSRLRSSMPTKP